MAKFKPNPKKISSYDQPSNTGWLHGFLGTGANAEISIAFIIIVTMLLIGSFVIFNKEWGQAMDFWKSIIIPLLTLVIGYVLGKGSNK